MNFQLYNLISGYESFIIGSGEYNLRNFFGM